jgi:hypothetical protein
VRGVGLARCARVAKRGGGEGVREGEGEYAHEEADGGQHPAAHARAARLRRRLFGGRRALGGVLLLLVVGRAPRGRRHRTLASDDGGGGGGGGTMLLLPLPPVLALLLLLAAEGEVGCGVHSGVVGVVGNAPGVAEWCGVSFVDAKHCFGGMGNARHAGG